MRLPACRNAVDVASSWLMEITFHCRFCETELAAEADTVGHTADCPQCGHVLLVPVPELEPGTVLGGFRVTRRLGRGGMGEVFLARQLSMDRDVALKILSPSLTRDDAVIARFREEVRTLANLRHPNIVTAFDAGADSGFHYLAMGYVQGEDLGEPSGRGPVLAEKRMLQLFVCVCEALSYAWDEMQLIHHDIKPSNIIVDTKGAPFLLDFGLAKPLTRETAAAGGGGIAGTPHYMSPEILRRDSAPDFRSDMYSLGATMYCVATGEPPYRGDSIKEIAGKHLTAPIPDPRLRRKNLSDGFAWLVQSMMAKNARDRHKSWQALIDDFYNIGLGQATAVRGLRARPGSNEGARQRALRRRRHRRLIQAAVLGVGALVAYLVWRWLMSPVKR